MILDRKHKSCGMGNGSLFDAPECINTKEGVFIVDQKNELEMSCSEHPFRGTYNANMFCFGKSGDARILHPDGSIEEL